MTEYFTKLLINQCPDVEFLRIIDNQELSSSNIPYTDQYLAKLIVYFEDNQEYEKCRAVSNYRLSKNKHSEKWMQSRYID